MRVSVLLGSIAGSTLFLAACGGSGPTADAENIATNEALAGLGNEALDADELPGDVDLVDLPEPPADAPAAEVAPLRQAAAIEEEIDEVPAVERVPYEGGWAWRRDGRIIRTASRDGRRVSYFRPGESTPFLVQRGEETFAYRAGQAQRAFDRRGRPTAVSPQRQEEARRLAEQSRREREQAERAPRRPDRDRSRDDRTDNRAGDGRGDEPTRAARPDRDGQGNGVRRDDRGGDRERRRDDRRTRSDDAGGNRQ